MDSFGASSRTSNGLARTHHTQLSEHITTSSSHPISPLLLERLQRSRKVENDRMSAQSSNDMLSASGGSRHVRSPSPTSSHRPRSGGGLDSAKPKKGLGVKEMEQTLSSLHKQNFDLKLELYHRRERQTVLEERVDALERDVRERDELNESLMKELEKRDKAVEEAIGMILTLEKRVEQLLLERKMVRQVEAQGPTYSRINSPVTTPAPKKTHLETTSFDESKTPIRMPSFVSEISETTENLRNVYLSALAGESTLTLQRFPEDTPDTVRMDPRLASPALSELSESSFVSIYGGGRTVDLSMPPGDSPWPWDGPRTPRRVVESPTRVKSATPSKQHRPNSSRVASGQYHNIGCVLNVGPSPLQRLENLDVARVAARDSERPSTATREHNYSASPRPATSQAQPKTKKEKREALERVLTQTHFNSPQTLPPTPDTLSSTTLPQNETPTREDGTSNNSNHLEASTPWAAHDDSKTMPQASQAASTTAFDSRKHLQTDESACTTPAAFDARPAHPVGAKTDERTRDCSSCTDVPRRRSNTRRDSTASSVDTWLRESMKPETTDALGPMSSVSQARASPRNGRMSPDLFSFPTPSSGWAANAMFGTLGGTGYMRAGGKKTTGTSNAGVLDTKVPAVPAQSVMKPGQMTPVAGVAPPPPPNRRSSLAAKTGCTADVTPGTEGILRSHSRAGLSSAQMRSPARGSSRTRSNSTDVRPPTRHVTEFGLKHDRAMTVPPKQVHHPPPAPEQQHNTPSKQDTPNQSQPRQRHYPPTTSRPRSRGFNSLFRRSTGSADVPAPPASAPPTNTPFRPPPQQQQQQQSGITMGIPSWVRRASLADDDRASATPPPIMRNKVGTSGGGRVLGPDDDDGDGGAVLEPATAGVMVGTPGGGSIKLTTSSRRSWAGQSGGDLEGGQEHADGGVPLGGNGGGKRKWLGLGRVSSLRNRGGT